MEKDFKFLLDRMKQNRPVLLLGAGFSAGAKNGSGEPLPIGWRLSQNLYNHFFENGVVDDLDPEISKEIANKKDDLKEICTYLRLLNKVSERDAFLTQSFQHCQPSCDGFHEKLINYEWDYIFTLNIDDLVESIYKRAGIPLSVWDRAHLNGNSTNATTNLIKLHGSVTVPQKGYVFDSEEYRDFSIDGDSLLKEFAHQALQHDLILIGTQFQEEDLKAVLDIYERSGYSQTPFYRFFILPNLSGKLKLQLQSSPNNIWIKGDTQTFLEQLNEKIAVPNREKSFLREVGAVFLDELNRNTPSSYDLYKGKQTVYADFFHNADISSTQLSQWKEEISSSKGHILMAFFGESYIGKSCFIKRLLVDLADEKYTAIQLNRLDENIFEILIQYLSMLPNKTKVAIYADNASYYYSQFLELKKECSSNVERLILLLEDTIANHQGKEYLLLDDPDSSLHFVSVKMDAGYAQKIFDKLSRNNRLNKYLDLLPKKQNPFSRQAREKIISQIMKENDIIDALYYSTEGEPFQRHYSRWLTKNASDTDKKVLYSLCYLNRLGIAALPNPLVAKIGQLQSRGFQLSSFVKKYSDVVSVSPGWLRLHRGRILSTLIGANDPELIIQTLHQAAIYAVPANEGRHDERTSIFERAISVKRIRNSGLLSKNDILTLLEGLESPCKHVSYFWVQFGIAAQINGEFEDASNHLRYAKSMRPHSYQVNHALANNEMVWGIHQLSQNLGDGDSKFLHGAEAMYEIAVDGKFSKSYRYSVHSYVRMWLEHSKATNRILNKRTAQQCAALLEKLFDHPLDNRLSSLIKQFITYCENHEMRELVPSLKKVYKIPERFHVEKETYEIE